MKYIASRPWIPLAVAALALTLGILPAAAGAGCGKCGGCPRAEADSADETTGCCGMGRGRGNATGAGQGAADSPAPGHGRGMGKARGHHKNIHGLLDRHDAIKRVVNEIDGGVETLTTSDDPEVTAMLRTHVREMKERVESGHGLRWWDPTFAELFKHHDKIEMTVEDVPGGVRVRETSEDPAVTALIRQHAIRGVSEFVETGWERARRPTPLPEGYTP